MKRLIATVSLAATAVLTAPAPVAAASGPYSSCSEAAEDGVYNIPEDSDDYWSGGDRDDDGIACESSG